MKNEAFECKAKLEKDTAHLLKGLRTVKNANGNKNIDRTCNNKISLHGTMTIRYLSVGNNSIVDIF